MSRNEGSRTNVGIRGLAIRVLVLSSAGVSVMLWLVLSATPDPSVNESPGCFHCQTTVDGIRRILDTLQYPESLFSSEILSEDRPPVNFDEIFEPTVFFSVLDRLHMHPGYTLSWVESIDFHGKCPYLYARRVDSPAFTTFTEYEESTGGFDLVTNQPKHKFWRYVDVDGTPESYFQLVVMIVECPHYFLTWHANYSDDQIICTRGALRATLPQTCFPGGEPSEATSKALTIDVSPVLTVDRDSALVSVVMFTKWGGFSRTRFKFSTTYPHELLDVRSTQLVKFFCGYVF